MPAVRVDPRTVLVSTESALSGSAKALGLDARAASHDHRADLDRQVVRQLERAAEAGHQVVGVEAGGGLGVNWVPP